MPDIVFRHAIREALDEELARDERVVLLGEDVAAAGGVVVAAAWLRRRAALGLSLLHAEA